LKTILNMPFVVFGFSLVVLWLSVEIGALVGHKLRSLQDDERQDLGLLLTASLTLLALIIAFCFAMAVGRYDQRKNYEEDEANAIGTEYVRVDMLPATDAARVRTLLKQYLDQRVLFYITRDVSQLDRIASDTTKLQTEMWSIVQADALARPTPPMALTVSGMNDVLNSQGYTQAAWWNRIPAEAWILMLALAICCNLMTGYGARSRGPLLFTVLPLVLSVAFFLIADIDSPRRGVIRVLPQNLLSLSQSLQK
jgi:hypothetical protein